MKITVFRFLCIFVVFFTSTLSLADPLCYGLSTDVEYVKKKNEDPNSLYYYQYMPEAEYVYLGRFGGEHVYAGAIIGDYYESSPARVFFVRKNLSKSIEFCVDYDGKNSTAVIYDDDYKIRSVVPDIQILYQGCMPFASTATAQGFSVEISLGCSRYDERDNTTDQWQWKDNVFTLFDRKTTYLDKQAREQFKKYLAEHRYIEAINNLPDMHPSGHSTPCYPISEYLIQALHPRIMSEYKQGLNFSAYTQAMFLLNQAQGCDQKAIFGWHYRHHSRDDEGKGYNWGPGNSLDISQKNASILVDFADIIKSLEPRTAKNLLVEVKEKYPDIPKIYRILADIKTKTDN